MEGSEVGLQGAEEELKSGEAEAGSVDITAKIQAQDMLLGAGVHQGLRREFRHHGEHHPGLYIQAVLSSHPSPTSTI